jgi:adenylate cyclase
LPLQIGIRPALITASVVLLLVTVGGVSTMGYRGTKAALLHQFDHELELTSMAVTSEVKRVLERAPQLVEQAEGLILNELISLDDPEYAANVLVEAIRGDEHIGWFGYAEPGAYVGGTRSRGGPLRAYMASPDLELAREWQLEDAKMVAIPTAETEHYSPEKGAWYKDTVASPALRWSAPYTFTDGERGLSVLKGILRDGEVVGVVAADFFIADLEDWLNALRLGAEGRVMLVTGDGAVIGLGPSEGVRQAVLDAPREPFMELDIDDVLYLVSWATLELTGGAQWRIVAVVPEAQLRGPADAILRRSMGLGVLVLLGGILLSAWLATVIARPFREVSEQLEAVGSLRLGKGPMPTSVIREAGLMASQFEHMRAGLRSFAYYVPMDLVRLLLSEGREATLGVESKEMTLMFTDIVSFTTTTESTRPDILIDALAEYLEMVNRAVTAEGGTILSYLGDGVLIVWGAPLEQADHALCACRAALAIDKASEALAAASHEAGKPELRTRIGINTGDALIGNVGARERFNYTPIGDAVNTAARIEAINKEYGTRILVGERTVELLDGRLPTRSVDETSVKGKLQQVRVFELLDPDDGPQSA